MKTFLMVMVIVWFVLGASVADGRGYLDSRAPRTCAFVGSGMLTIVAGPINYAGLHPRAFC